MKGSTQSSHDIVAVRATREEVRIEALRNQNKP